MRLLGPQALQNYHMNDYPQILRKRRSKMRIVFFQVTGSPLLRRFSAILKRSGPIPFSRLNCLIDLLGDACAGMCPYRPGKDGRVSRRRFLSPIGTQRTHW